MPEDDIQGNKKWSRKRLNHEKTSAEFLLLRFSVVPPGIEPGTQGFSVLCSTN